MLAARNIYLAAAAVNLTTTVVAAPIFASEFGLGLAIPQALLYLIVACGLIGSALLIWSIILTSRRDRHNYVWLLSTWLAGRATAQEEASTPVASLAIAGLAIAIALLQTASLLAAARAARIDAGALAT